MPFPAMSPLQEIKVHLGKLADLFRRRRSFGDLLQVEVAQDIVADVATVQQQIGRQAFTAEQADAEAEKILTSVLADNHVSPWEIPELRKALRNVKRSEAHDHNITEAARV